MLSHSSNNMLNHNRSMLSHKSGPILRRRRNSGS
jgi:hypothetical protein